MKPTPRGSAPLVMRRLTLPGDHPLDQVRWVKRHVPWAKVRGVWAPDFWSDTAVGVLATRYFQVTDSQGKTRETSLRQVIERIVGALESGARRPSMGTKGALTAEQRQIFCHELSHLLVHQKLAFNSPVFFNLGLHGAYGLRAHHDCYRWDSRRRQALRVRDSLEHPPLSACFIQSVDDRLDAVFELARREALIFKYGGGSGSNFSNLRAEGEPLSRGGTAAGLMKFLKVLDAGAAAVKSGGTTRRAAKMVIVDADHPEIENFVGWKTTEEAKIKALEAAGFSSGLEGEAQATVSGQNSNNSVRVTDAFMRAVQQGSTWALRARTTGRVIKRIPARRLWTEMAQAAWQCGDPGVQFHDTINRWNKCGSTESIVASNPCSEFMFLNDTACNLASLNLLSFLDDHGRFQTQDFIQACRLSILAQDLIVDLASYPTAEIAARSVAYRPLGLGFANLGGLLMAQGIPYDSDLGRQWAAALAALMGGSAWAMSADLASQRGAFPRYQAERLTMMKVMARHQRALPSQSTSVHALEDIIAQARQQWGYARTQARRHGFRNAQVTAIAPTGTIALLMDCQTTGIEPEYALVRQKTMVGGATVQMTNTLVPRALSKLGYDKLQVKKLMAHLNGEGYFSKGCGLAPSHFAVFDVANPSTPGGCRLRPESHLLMMAAVQPFICGAISKTVNLPHEATVSDVRRLYLQAWKLGLKSVAVYRDGSKAAQPLQARSLNQCPQCQNDLEASGQCLKCPHCGTTLGCAI